MRGRSLRSVLVGLAMTLFPAAAPAAVPECPQPLGLWGRGPAQAAAWLTSDLAVVGAGAMVTVVDLSDPSLPRPLGEVQLPGLVVDLASAPAGVVAVTSHAGLWVVDWSVPSAPRVVGGLDPGRAGMALAVDGGLAAVAGAEDGLWLVDLGDPARPREVGHIATTGDARDVALDRGFAFVAAGSGLDVVDLHDPAAPRVVASVPTRYSCRGVAVADGLAHLAASDPIPGFPPVSSCHLVNISDPVHPFQVGELAMRYPAWAHVAVVGQLALLTPGDPWVVDVSDPASPRLVVSASGPGVNGPLVVEGELAVAAHGDLGVYEVSDPLAVVELGSLPSPWVSLEVAVARGHAYVSAEARGVRVLDLEDPTRPRETGWLAGDGTPVSRLLADDGLLLALGPDALSLFDLSLADEPRLLDAVAEPWGWPHDAALDGSLLAVAHGGGVELLDLTDPLDLRHVASVATEGLSLAVALGDDLLVTAGLGAAAYEPQVEVYDLQDPTAPSRLAVAPLAGADRYAASFDLALDGRWAWVVAAGSQAWGGGGPAALEVIDLQQPSFPAEVATVPLPGAVAPATLALVGDRLAVAAGDLTLLDLSRPWQPRLLAVHETEAAARGLALLGEVAVLPETYLLETVSLRWCCEQPGLEPVSQGVAGDEVLAAP